NQDFALVFDPPPFTVRNPNAVAEKFKELGLKKGNAVVIRNARRTRAEREGGQGFVVLSSLGALEEAEAGASDDGKKEKGNEGDREESGGKLLGVVSGPLQMTKWMMELLRQRDESSLPEEREKMCDGKFDGCVTPRGKEGDLPGEGLKRCQGCVEVWYCSKECQKRRWIAHKDECKAIKALRRIWPSPEGVE
ncbi:hypothetical protein N0V85_000557, partial [Neurospora sp. IMI 360204]